MSRGDSVVLADEQAAQRRYRDAVRRQDPRPKVAQGGRRGTPAGGRRPDSDGLIGRVLLDRTSDIFDAAEFYIGLRYVEEDGLQVFSWTNPIACTFFQGAHHHEHCPHVATRRTLQYRGGAVVGYVDEHDRPAAGSFGGRSLSVASPSRRRALPQPAQGPAPTPTPAPVPVPHEAPATAAVPAPRTSARRPSRKPGKPARKTVRKPEPTTLRAADAVRAAISAPRRERLGNVLRTLQPDQYHLVTTDPGQPLIVHGPPGSGKTIIAAHRAAFLVDDDAGKGHPPCRRVLVVGPTEHYVDHIRGAVHELVDDASTVQPASLDAVLRHLRGLAPAVDDGIAEEDRDVDADFMDLVLRAVEMLQTADELPSGLTHDVAVERVYTALRANEAAGEPVIAEPEWSLYLRRLPAFRTAVTARRFLPLLAACALALRGPAGLRYDHVVVDEAQDVTGLEWALLRYLNSGGWTVLGDRAQRRSDYSCRTWADVREAIERPDARIESVEHGYRTSSAIMEYASRLLPQVERTVRSLQAGGTPPRRTRAVGPMLWPVAAREAVALRDTHPEWTVAVVTMKPGEILAALRAKGFVVDSRRPDVVRRAGKVIRVLNPHQARGLEFDAVVVVEPASFPTRMGRHGLLYTSLTRANRELAVVHSQALPAELSRRSCATAAAI
ncbi:ATP-binding domain-containing protein [Pseudonocardia nematodicida]|uniref:ATP-binding domain-containing protein n=1 Tax=Pseudonocardia nematodicida TaxID=1206997 RepID=A0ABV1KHH1_9PSEU